MVASFIESGFTTKTEYEAWVASGAGGSAGGSGATLKVYYWPFMIRSAPLVRMLEHTSTPYEHIGPPDLMALGSAWGGTGCNFAPPIVVDGDYKVSQSVACSLYVGKRTGLIPKKFDECLAVQFMGDIVDTFENNLGKNNEQGPTLKKFLTGERWPKLLANIERAIVGPYYFGDEPSCVDFFLLGHVDWRNTGMFDRLMKEKGLGDWLAACPKIKALTAALRAAPGYKNYSGKLAIVMPSMLIKDEVLASYDA